jgi:hypothetical protein
LDKSVLEEELLVVSKNFRMLLRILKNVKRNAVLQRKGIEFCHILADSRWEMLLKAVGKPLSTAKKGI